MSSKRRQQLAIVSPPRQADPARAALSEAIAGLNAANQAAVDNERAINKARQLCVERERVLEEAESKVSVAQDQLVASMAQAITDDTPPPLTSPGLVTADSAVRAAVTALQAARVTLDRLKGDTRAKQVATHAATVSRNNAVDDVLAPTIAALVEQAERARVIVHESARLLEYLLDPMEDRRETAHFQWKQGDGMQLHRERRPEMDNLRAGMRNFLNCYRQDIHTRSQELVRAWESARAGLKVDASTPLPPLPGDA